MADNKLAELIAAALAEAAKLSDPEKRRLVQRYLRLANEAL